MKSTPFTSTIWSPTCSSGSDAKAVQGSSAAAEFKVCLGYFFFLKGHLESDFCGQGAWLDVADVDPRFLGRTTGDADAHSPGAHKAEENLLLLDFFASDGRQACNTAFFLL